MTTQRSSRASGRGGDRRGDRSLRYLQHNPDFFERHQALLARLRLPHARGGSTISLVERQVEVLREQHAGLERKLADSSTWRAPTMRSPTSSIASRARLLRARTPRRGHRADRSQPARGLRRLPLGAGAVRRARPTLAPQRFLRIGRAPRTPNLKSFETLFASGKPRCGQVARLAARIPVRRRRHSTSARWRWCRSASKAARPARPRQHDRDRFHPGMSTDSWRAWRS